MRGTLGAVILLAMAVFGVARTQPRLASIVHAAKEGDDIYALPPPSELHAATLGWDAAVVDLLWTKLLVEYGTHWSEHREFHDTSKYADAILELEPNFAPIYKYVDTMLAYRPMQGTEDDVRLARAYLERGTRERSDDPSVWMEYGQFLAFIAPSFLHDDVEREAWRREGATAIGHAVERGAAADRALAAATILTRAGATQAAIGSLERAYAFTEHPSMMDVHEAIGRRLAALQATAQRDAADAELGAIHARWKAELPFLTRDQYLLLGPKIDVIRCAGLRAASEPQCARDWSAGSGEVNAGPLFGSSAGSP